MRKVVIRAPRRVATLLEEKLRNAYEVRLEEIPDNPKSVCQIKAKISRKWITICSFASDENLMDIVTMFEVNYNLKRKT
jgi:hypothetical protein